MKKSLLILSGLLLAGLTSYSQTQLYGLTSQGGTQSLGTSFVQQSDAPYTHTYSSFKTIVGAGAGSSHMIKVGDLFYGTTIADGPLNGGVLYSWNPVTNEYLDLAYFGSIGGELGFGGLYNADGVLYGMTTEGGVNDGGLIYKYTISLGTLEKVADLDEGALPYGTFTEHNGLLLAYTSGAGLSGYGSVISLDPETDEVNTIHSFNGLDGYAPYGTLLNVDGTLWGTTSYGGDFNSGTLFRLDYDNGYMLSAVVSFDESNAYDAEAKLTYLNGKLYGASVYGGFGQGVIIEYDIDNQVFTPVYYFAEDGGPVNTYGEFTVVNGLLYGMSFVGGTNNMGTIYAFDPVSQNVSVLHNFDSITGANPEGSFLEYDGKLYGATYAGGKEGYGVIFEFNPNSSDLNVKVNLRENFGQGTTQLIDISNRIFGTSVQGGHGYAGMIYEMDPVTSKTTKKFEFAGSSAGQYPAKYMAKYAGKLIGTTTYGGDHGTGTIFSFDPNTSAVQVLESLKSSIELKSGITVLDEKLYAVIRLSNGVNEMMVYDFGDDEIDYYPIPSDMGDNVFGEPAVMDGNLYMLANSGGETGLGSIYKWDPQTHISTLLINLSATDAGIIPNGALIAYNGRLYGLTPTLTGSDAAGTLFSYDPEENNLDVLVNFGATTINAPGGTPSRKGGKFYGSVYGGGTNGVGGIFEFDLEINEFNVIHNFDMETGYASGPKLLILSTPELIVSNLPYLSTCAGSNLVIPFGTTENFPNGTVFTAYMSDSTGNFDDQVELGSTVATSSGEINGTIPVGTIPASGYRVKVVATGGAFMVSPEEITINNYLAGTPPVASIAGTDICDGNFTKVYTTRDLGTYQWYKNGVRILGATTDATIVGTTGNYKVLVTDQNGCKTFSESIDITSHKVIATTSPTGVQEVCANELLSITGNSGYDHQWFKDGVAISGQTAQSLNVHEPGSYELQNKDQYGCKAVSKNIFVTHKPVPAKPKVSFVYPDLVSNAPSGNQWYKNDVALTGETGTTLKPSGNAVYKVSCMGVNGCSSMSDTLNFQSTGIAANAMAQLSLYPNPAIDVVVISGSEGSNFQVIDISGKIVATGVIRSGKATVNVSAYAAGTYTVKVAKAKEQGTSVTFVKL